MMSTGQQAYFFHKSSKIQRNIKMKKQYVIESDLKKYYFYMIIKFNS